MRISWGRGAQATGLLASFIHSSIAASSEPSAIISSPTLTSNLAGRAAPSVCCFVFQDTVTEIWAQLYTTSIFNRIVNLTSYTVRVTPGPQTTETNIETNTYTTNASFTSRVAVGANPIPLFNNVAPGPSEVNSSYNSSQLTTHGVTVPSPQAVYIYSSMKIITASPVTDSAGNLACATPTEILGGQVTVNSNAQAFYYGVPSLSTVTSRIGIAKTITKTFTITYDTGTAGNAAKLTTTTTTLTETTATTETFLINSQNQSVSIPSTRPPGVMISFETPFVYQPTSGASGSTHVGQGNCYRGTGSEGWGYPPQTLLDYMIQNPAISKQYPGLESCFPGGPSIITSAVCSVVAPAFQFAGGDLTESTVLIITQGDSVPTAIPITTDPAPEPTVAPPSPETTSHAAGSTPGNPPADDGAIASAIAGGIGATPNQAPEVTRTLPGSTTVVDGTLQVVIPPTTVAVNAQLPGLSGSPTVISGVSYVVITATTTVPVVTTTSDGSPSAPSQVTGSGAAALRLNGFLLVAFSSICILAL